MKVADIAKDLIYLMEIKNLMTTDESRNEKELGSNNNTKLNKILYIVMGVSLKIGLTPNEAAINNSQKVVVSMFDELPAVWPYGPVFHNIYQNYAKLRMQALSENYILSYKQKDNKNILQQRDNKIIEVILNAIIDSDIVKQTAQELSEWSSVDGSPWGLIYKSHLGHCLGLTIDNLKIKNYFAKLSNQDLYGLDIDKIESCVRKIKNIYKSNIK
jgi:uncharacterized phage-associated protein